MVERDITIVNRLGLHARAAAKFVQLAGRFRARIRLARDGHAVDGKSILGILTLAASKGTSLILKAEGPDEREAVEALIDLIEDRFGEGQ